MRWRTLAGLGVWWAVVAIAFVGLFLVVVGEKLRLGGMILAAAILLAAVLRALLPSPKGGGLEVRSRSRDVLTLLAAALLVFLAFFLVKTCDPPSAQIGGGRADNCPPAGP